MAVDDGCERGGQVVLRIDGIEFAGLNERGDDRPVLGSNVVPGEECILPIDRYRPDGSLDGVVIDLDAAVGQEELQTIPVFSNIGQSLAEWRLGRNTGSVMDEPCLHVGDQRRSSWPVPRVK
jgi:hypothetical protein